MTTLRQRLDRALDRLTRRGIQLGPHEVRIRHDLRVPLDDGVVLLADLYEPIGADLSLPTIVIRGPYGRSGMIGGSARALAYEGFTVVFVSSRGTWGSGGVFRPQIDEQRDGIATYRWVRAQPWFTGRLATFGESYMGYTQWAAAGRMLRDEPDQAPEALVLQVTMPDFGAITWDNGAYSLRNALGWSRMMDRMERGGLAILGMLLPDPKLEKAFDVLPLSEGDSAVAGRPIRWYQDWVAHERLSDEYWTQQSHTATVPDVTVPVLMVSGWYDIFLPWQLRNYAQLAAAGNAPQLTVGPWGHVSRGKLGPAHRESIAFLKEVFTGESSNRVAPVRAFQTGLDQWHDLEIWPPKNSSAQSWFLQADGRLATEPAQAGISEYTYDPTAPTPSVGGPSLQPKTEPVDNAAHEQRPDVLAFRSATLSMPIDIAGEPIARIRIASSAPSFDVFVRITDVHPDGRVMTVCDGIRRVGSVGTVATDPPVDEEGFREVAVPLWPTFHRFAPGHQVGIQLSSGAHPRYARNPGTGEPAFSASSTRTAVQRLAHGASRIDLPVWVDPAQRTPIRRR